MEVKLEQTGGLIREAGMSSGDLSAMPVAHPSMELLTVMRQDEITVDVRIEHEDKGTWGLSPKALPMIQRWENFQAPAEKEELVR